MCAIDIMNGIFFLSKLLLSNANSVILEKILAVVYFIYLY